VKVLDGPWERWQASGMPTSLTVGVLDGVHRGHRRLLEWLDPELLPTVLTFDPHPVEVLRPGTPPRLITNLEERVELLDDAGVACVGVLDLRQIKEQAPVEFVENVLLAKLDMTHMVVGADFRFGKDRAGDVALLETLGDSHGFDLEVVELVSLGDEVVSSSRIRALVEDGHVAEAADLLGSRFTLSGEVIDGEKRGRNLGFPTANLRPPTRKLIPGNGVYACYATVDGSSHDAAVNVGVRPTFGDGELLIEAYLIDFSDDIYGRELTLSFVEFLRPEVAFGGLDELIERIDDDVDRTREILAAARSRM
jgi:riboflavin kinase/FMN adenylyltransferase